MPACWPTSRLCGSFLTARWVDVRLDQKATAMSLLVVIGVRAKKMHYDFWWNLPRDYMVTSEWGLPPQFENGIVPEDLLSNKYGHHIHFWDLRARRNVQTIDLGANHQMGLEVRPAHDPAREYGFLGVVVDTTNLEGSIWTWWREGGKFHIEKTGTIPPEPPSKDQLPPLPQQFGAVPPPVTAIGLAVDGLFLYRACW